MKKIIDRVHMDKYGRITLSNIGIEAFDGIKLIINPGSEMVEVVNAKNFEFGLRLELDQAHRLTIPKWIREEIGGEEYLFVLIDEETSQIFLSVKTGNIL